MALGDSMNRAINSWVAQFAEGVYRLGDAAIEHIRLRTRRGVGPDGEQYQPYSENYARRKKGGATTPVTLTDTGEMLGSMQVIEGGRATAEASIRSTAVRGASGRFESLRDQKVVIGFPPGDAAMKAIVHHEGRGVPRRPFMGLEDLWVQEGIDREMRQITIPPSREQVEIRVL